MRYLAVVGLVINMAVCWGEEPAPFEWWPSIFDKSPFIQRPLFGPSLFPQPTPGVFGLRSGDSAVAAAELTPDTRHQLAAISPENPDNPNVEITATRSGAPTGRAAVSSRSSVSSVIVNGKEQTSRRAETVVDDNGEVKRYSVSS